METPSFSIRTFRILAAGLIMTTCALAQAQVNLEWVQTYNGPENTYDGAINMTTDGAGNVYVTGFSNADVMWLGGNYLTMKYNWAGQLQWTALYSGPNEGEDKPTGIAVDDSGNVYVTGWSHGIGTDDDITTIKYNGTGVEQWVARYNGPGNGNDFAQMLTLDHAGNILVCGASVGAGSLYWDQVAIKYNPDGVEQWVARYAAPAGGNDVAMAVAVDSADNVVITGWAIVAGDYYDYCTVKFSSAGVQQWVATYAYHAGAYDYESAYALGIDAQGNVYVTGLSDGDTSSVENDDYTTIKYNPDGVQQWVARYNGTANGTDNAWWMAVTPGGEVYVTGVSEGAGSQGDIVTIKYNSAGQEQWVARRDGGNNLWDGALDVSVNALGEVFVAGWIDAASQYLAGDAALIKYNGSGVEQWIATYGGPPGSEDWNSNVELASDGDIYAAGVIGNGSNQDFLVLKYDEPDVAMVLTPHNPPIQIPAGGGSFEFDMDVSNTGASAYTIDLWTTVTLPGGAQYPIFTRSNLSLPAGSSISRPDLTQFVPGSALPGEYLYNGFIRDHGTWEVLAEDHFPFTKLAGEAASNHNYGWALFGWDGEPAPSRDLPLAYALQPVSPNPFNPAAEINYQLPSSGLVHLTVHDVQGRLVITLVDGWQEAGTHEVRLDGSKLPSGLYLVKMHANDFSAVQKAVLIK